jgi:hypothetical protein
MTPQRPCPSSSSTSAWAGSQRTSQPCWPRPSHGLAGQALPGSLKHCDADSPVTVSTETARLCDMLAMEQSGRDCSA